MPHGVGCPPGTDLDFEDCHQVQRQVPAWTHWSPLDRAGWLPKCFLWDGVNVHFNIGQGGRVPPSKYYNRQQAICKKTLKQKPPGESSFPSYMWIVGHTHSLQFAKYFISGDCEKWNNARACPVNDKTERCTVNTVHLMIKHMEDHF